MCKKRHWLIIGVLVVAALLISGGVAAAQYIFQRQLSGNVTIVPAGDISVNATLDWGIVHPGDNVTSLVTVRNNSQTAVTISASDVVNGGSGRVATIARWPLLGAVIPVGQQLSDNCTFTISDNQSQWGGVSLIWTVYGHTD